MRFSCEMFLLSLATSFRVVGANTCPPGQFGNVSLHHFAGYAATTCDWGSNPSEEECFDAAIEIANTAGVVAPTQYWVFETQVGTCGDLASGDLPFGCSVQTDIPNWIVHYKRSPTPNCNRGAYSLVCSGDCAQCSAGRYQDLTGQSSCPLCSKGSYSGPGSAACTACASGTYSFDGASACTSCPAGTFQDSASQSSCMACSTGYTSLPGATMCTPCAAGDSEPTCTGSCFSGDSTVSVLSEVTHQVTEVPLHKLNVGDLVGAVDQHTRQEHFSKVVALPRSPSYNDFIEVTTHQMAAQQRDNHKVRKLLATDHHTFPLCGTGFRKETAAMDLKKGDCLLTEGGGKSTVASTTRVFPTENSDTFTVVLEGSDNLLLVGGIVTHAKSSIPAEGQTPTARSRFDKIFRQMHRSASTVLSHSGIEPKGN